MINEEWKEIPEYQGIYEASNFGNIRSLDKTINCNGSKIIRKGKTLSLFQKKSNGYLHVNLYREARKSKSYRVHRLIGITFIGNPPTKKHQINHINGIKYDNRVENLEWCTAKENISHSNKLGLRGNTAKERKITWEQVEEIRKKIDENHTQQSIADEYGVSRQLIGYIKNGKRRLNPHIYKKHNL